MLFFLIAALIAAHVISMPIDDYVWTKDENYKWIDMGEDYILRGKGFTGYTLNMTSQKWLTDDDFAPNSQAKSIWWHYLVVIVPDEITYKDTGMLYITGMDQGSSPPKLDNEELLLATLLGVSSGVVTGTLFQVPNQHTIFASDPLKKSRSEDAVIAFTWDHYLRDPEHDPKWLVRFPMVKASVRAMDAITEFMTEKFPEKEASLKEFAVAGASKRGWTTWLVGAVDSDRVKLIVPIVLDAINFIQFSHHQFKSYGAWTFALKDYTEMNLMSRIDTPEMLLLAQQEDPYYFKDRLTMPKLVVNAGMDEFQQPDDTHYWWSEMPEPKHFIMTPNAEHSMATGILEVVPAVSAWIQYHLRNETVPKFDWTINNETGTIVATLDNNGIVHEASVWYAYSCGYNKDGNMRRDFRLAMLDDPCTCGIIQDGTCANVKSFWSRIVLEQTTVKGHRTYAATLPKPTDGRHLAFFIDITYNRSKRDMLDQSALTATLPHFIPRDLAGRLEFTTEVSIFPDTFPYPDCSGDDCTDNLC